MDTPTDEDGRRLAVAHAAAAMLVQALTLLTAGAATLCRRVRDARASEDGFTVAEYLAMGALGVVAIAGLWVLMAQLGEDIIDKIRDMILGGDGGNGAPSDTCPAPPC